MVSTSRPMVSTNRLIMSNSRPMVIVYCGALTIPLTSALGRHIVKP